MYKTKLQELCDVKKWAYPKYSAIKVGADHDPRFTASVFINGAFFDSPTPCKSLKEAQHKAAEVALIHFISLSGDGLKTKDTSKSILPAEVGEVAKKRLEKISKSVAILRERASEVAELDMNSLSLNEYSQESRPKKAQGENSKSKKNEKIDPAEMGGSSSIKGKEKLMDDKENAAAEETVHLKKQKDREMEISLLGKRFGVYSYVPDIANLPKGLTVMQVCEGKWIIMSLEFPNEKPT